jgi:recombination protein RecA
MFNRGINSEGDLLDLAVTRDIVNKQGSWYSYGDVRLGQGRSNAITFLSENEDLIEEIRAAVLAELAPHLLTDKQKAELAEDAGDAEAEKD